MNIYQITENVFHFTDHLVPYDKIAEKQFYIKTKGQDIFAIKFDDIPTLLEFAYYRFYLEMVYEIICKGGWEYLFINPVSSQPTVEIPPAEEMKGHLNISFKELATDIVKRGTFFPFYGTKQQNQSYSIRQGKHRWCGLTQEQVNREFLFISYEHPLGEICLNTKVKIPLIDIENMAIIFMRLQQTKEISERWYLYSEQVANALNKYQIDFHPFRGWDNQQIFQQYITGIDEFEWLKNI